MRKNKFVFVSVILMLTLSLALFAACGDDAPADPPATEVVQEVEAPAPEPEPEPEPEVEPEPEPEPEPEEDEPVLVEFPPGAVYSLFMDVNVQALDTGTMGASNVLATPYLMEAGSPSFTIVEGLGGNNAIQLTNREENWHALDLSREHFDWDPANNEYLLTVRGNLPFGAGSTVIIGGPDSPWGWFANTEADENGDFIVSVVVSDETMSAMEGGAGQFDRGFRIQTNDTQNMIIYSINLDRYIPRDENVIYSLSTDPLVQFLADGVFGAGNVLATPVLMQAGDPSWSIVENPNGGNAIQLTNRGENWHALDINRQNILDFDMDTANNEYLLTVTGTIFFGGTAIVGGPDSPWGWFGNQEIGQDEDFEITVTLSDAAFEDTGSPEQFVRGFRIQTDNTNNLTVYDIVITRQ
ncbi:MAG: hypothetical protein FWG64_13580 [Firmicutes bacterium]|nr:hypothetical protein [Bacillota bacterium]